MACSLLSYFLCCFYYWITYWITEHHFRMDDVRMAVFQNRETMERIHGEIWNQLIRESNIGLKMKEAGINILFRFTDPDMVMFIDDNGARFGEAAEAQVPVITESMSGDTAHRFWLNKIDMPRALASHQIKAKGSATKMLQLLPLLSIVQEVYPAYCKKYDLPLE